MSAFAFVPYTMSMALFIVLFDSLIWFGRMSEAMTKTPSSVPYPKMLGPNNKSAEVRDPNTGRIVSVPTKMNYVTPDTIEINIRRHIDGCDSGMEGATWDPTEVDVLNARGMGKTLDFHGFELVEDTAEGIDYLDTDQVIDMYYPSCERLLRNALGPDVDVVKSFDHNVRISSDSISQELKGSGASKAQVPIGEVHGDYTKSSGPKRLHDLSSAPKANDVLKNRLEGESLLDPKMVNEAIAGKRRFALVNVWRSIDTTHAIEEVPLACVESATVSEKDLKVLKIHYKDRIGQNYLLSSDKQHKWCYYPAMVHDEALMIKQWDSRGDFNVNGAGKIATFAVHSAFLDPTSPENARPRKSIEVRVAIIWKEDQR